MVFAERVFRCGWWIIVSVPQVGYFGLAWAGMIGAATYDNLAYIAIGIGIVVGISTLLIRINTIVKTGAKGVVHEMQATGELPTTLERREIRQALESLDQKLDRLLENG